MRFSEVNGTFVKNSDHVLCDSVIINPTTNPGISVIKEIYVESITNHVWHMYS